MSKAAVIHVVDDDAPFRSALARVLQASGFEVLAYDSATSFLRSLANAKPGCILLDVQMPELDGLQLQDQLSTVANSWPIVFMSGQSDIPTSVRAIKAGAEDFLTKPISHKTLVEAIHRALLRFAVLQQSLSRHEALRTLIATLTPRESEVFGLMVRGKLNKQIAHLLGTSERTIKYHRQMIMQKLKVQTFAEAVSIAERAGILALQTEFENAS